MIHAVPICRCGRSAHLVEGSTIYPHIPALRNKSFYVCAPCDTRVGCHPGTTRALGELAGPRLRALRMQAHSLIDPLWQTAERHYTDLEPRKVKTIRSLARRRVYLWLSFQLGIPEESCHVGHADETVCQQIIDALTGVDYLRIRSDLR